MASNHHRLLLLLVATAAAAGLLLPSASAFTAVEYCDKGHDYPVKVSGVEIVPDPVVRGQPATFKISASTYKTITRGSWLLMLNTSFSLSIRKLVTSVVRLHAQQVVNFCLVISRLYHHTPHRVHTLSP